MIYIARRTFENENDRSNENMITTFMFSQGNWVDIIDLAIPVNSIQRGEEIIMKLNNEFKDYYAYYYLYEKV